MCCGKCWKSETLTSLRIIPPPPSPATLGWAALGATNFLPHVCVLLFSFILGFNFISFRFKLIIIYYHTQKQREIKLEPCCKDKIDSIIHVHLQNLTLCPWMLIPQQIVSFCPYNESLIDTAYLVKMAGNWLFFVLLTLTASQPIKTWPSRLHAWSSSTQGGQKRRLPSVMIVMLGSISINH